MTYQKKIYILSGLVYDYEYCDSRQDYFDYDEPMILMTSMVLLNRMITECVVVFMDRMAPGMKTTRPP